MTSRKLVAALVALSLLSSGAAFGQGRSQGQGQGQGQGHRQDQDERSYQKQRGNNGQWQREQDRRAPRYEQERGYSRDDGRGAGPEHEFHRGQRLPMQYRHRQYVVDDWRGHRLSAPPRGYHWVQTGNDYVLVAIASGVILQLLLSQ